MILLLLLYMLYNVYLEYIYTYYNLLLKKNVLRSLLSGRNKQGINYW